MDNVFPNCTFDEIWVQKLKHRRANPTNVFAHFKNKWLYDTVIDEKVAKRDSLSSVDHVCLIFRAVVTFSSVQSHLTSYAKFRLHDFPKA